LFSQAYHELSVLYDLKPEKGEDRNQDGNEKEDGTKPEYQQQYAILVQGIKPGKGVSISGV